MPYADVATMSLDKTLRGPFGAVILWRGDLGVDIARAVHPGTQSSFSIRRLIDSAEALLLTQTSDFERYGRQVVANARALGDHLVQAGVSLLTGGTDKHYVVLDVRTAFGVSGEEAERALERLGILSSRQWLPSDVSARGADAGGIRLGTAWVTSRGYVTEDLVDVADLIVAALHKDGKRTCSNLEQRARELVRRSRPDDVWASPSVVAS